MPIILVRTVATICLCLAAIAGIGDASAQDYRSSDTPFTAGIDLRLIGVDGEPSWIDGGFGKTRFGPPDGRFEVEPRAIEADLVWQPQLSWSLGGTIAIVAQEGQEHAIDLSEAFLNYRGSPGPVRISGRAGLFWAPVSLEHAGPEWAVVETITPSAINSWIGEEVKVGAVEASASTAIGAGRLSGTLGLFGLNDTAGTLLAFRGWALHDVKATAFGLLPLPVLNDFMRNVQAADTRPVIELDDRPGFYAKLAWARPGMKVQALHYDNRGDPEVVTASRQWGWRTRFDSVGATLDLDAATRLTAQAISGRTEMGFRRAGLIWVDTRFRSAFLLATRQLGSGSVSGRIEAFGTHARGSVLASDEGEDGWAATLAARRRFGSHATLLAELLHVDSNRASRTRAGLDPKQRQTLLQLALRLRY